MTESASLRELGVWSPLREGLGGGGSHMEREPRRMTESARQRRSAWSLEPSKGIWEGGLGGGGSQRENAVAADLIDKGWWRVGFGVFSSFFSLLFLTWFLSGFCLDFGGVWEPKIDPQTCFGGVFCDVFVGRHFGINF